jgi:UDP-4-amino-4,6-dideoxy-N-acetyl-beta-L-altrosamine N-acetyltransferase
MKLNKILNSIQFEDINNLNPDEVLKIRDIRNEVNVRKYMTNNKKISIKEHLEWKKNFEISKSNFFYGIKYNYDLIGGLSLKDYNKKSLSGEWAFYISGKKNIIGLGASIEFLAIKHFFDFFKLRKLYCYVLNHNLEVVKLHKKFGFKEISFVEYVHNNSLPKHIFNAIYLSLGKSNWKNISKLIYQRYFL